jgi:hypothetical protein
LLDLYHDNSAVVLLVGETLLRILQNNRLQTQKSLHRLNALSAIVMIIKTHQAMSGSIAFTTQSLTNPHRDATVEQQIARATQDEFVRARHVMLSILVCQRTYTERLVLFQVSLYAYIMY